MNFGLRRDDGGRCYYKENPLTLLRYHEDREIVIRASDNLLPFVFSLLPGLVIADIGQRQEDCQTAQADDQTLIECFVIIGECNGVTTGGQRHTNHHIAHQNWFYGVSVYGHVPVTVLGDRGLQQAVTVGIDVSFYIGGGEFC